MDLEEPEIKIGPGKLFSDLDFGLGQQAKIVRSYNTGPKGVLGPGDFRSCGSGQNHKMDKLGIYVVNEAHFVILIYFARVVKLGKPKTSGPILILCLIML